MYNLVETQQFLFYVLFIDVRFIYLMEYMIVQSVMYMLVLAKP